LCNKKKQLFWSEKTAIANVQGDAGYPDQQGGGQEKNNLEKGG
jgi:hypothetical protein